MFRSILKCSVVFSSDDLVIGWEVGSAHFWWCGKVGVIWLRLVEVAIKVYITTTRSVVSVLTAIAVSLQNIVEPIVIVEELVVAISHSTYLVRCIKQLISCLRHSGVWSLDDICKLDRGVVVAVHFCGTGWGVGGVGPARTSRGLHTHSHTSRLVVEVIDILRTVVVSTRHGSGIVCVKWHIFESWSSVLPVKPELVDEAMVKEEFGGICRIDRAHSSSYPTVNAVVKGATDEDMPCVELGHTSSLTRCYGCTVGYIPIEASSEGSIVG